MSEQECIDVAIAKAVAECAGWTYKIDDLGNVCIYGDPAIEEGMPLNIHRFDHMEAACDAANVEICLRRKIDDDLWVAQVWKPLEPGAKLPSHAKADANPAIALALTFIDVYGVCAVRDGD